MRSIKILLILGVITNISTAQEAFVFNTIQSNQVSERAKANEADGFTYYELNETLFEPQNLQVGTSISVNTLSGQHQLQITRVSEYIPGILSVRAASETDDSQIFSFTYTDGRLKGLFHESHQEVVEFYFDSEEGSNFFKEQDHNPFICRTIEPDEPAKSLAPKEKNAIYAIQSNSDVFGSTTSETTIDIMVVYTNDASDYARQNRDLGSIDQIIAQSINLSQTAIDNNNIPVTLRVVHTHNTDYEVGFSEDSGDLLSSVTQSGDGVMDEVHGLRNQYGADLVALYANVTDVGGIAWRNRFRSGEPEYAFSISGIQFVLDSYVVMHELGHNIGLAHSRTQQQNAASSTGGVFQESVGYQDAAAGIVTVMGYEQEGISEIPYFSDPARSYNGTVLGTNTAANKTNAALTMKRMKDVIASYRPTKVNPPVSSFSTDEIEVNLTQGESIVVPFRVSNAGSSDLEFDVDFLHTFGTILKENTVLTKNALFNQSVLYSTSFESNQGYTVRNYEAVDSWRIYSGNDIRIDDQNPSHGSNHFRLTSTGTGQSRVAFGPYFGALPLGSYRVSFDVGVSNATELETEQFEVNFFDGKSENLSSAITIANGQFYVLGRSEAGGLINVATNKVVVTDTYYSIEIDYNSAQGTVSYFIDGDLVHEAAFRESGNTPAEIYLESSNLVEGTNFDFDNLRVTRYEVPYPWLEISANNGVASPNNSRTINLNFTSAGSTEGTYTTELVVTTNEDGASEFNIPITLNVSGPVSNEEEFGVPEGFNLSQNYPNPFNPSTKIEFSIPSQGMVTLKVYNALGQEVSTLINNSMGAGNHSAVFDASNLSSGLYFYTLEFRDTRLSNKMLLVK